MTQRLFVGGRTRSEQTVARQVRRYRPNLERLEELTLLSFSPLNYTLSLNAITRAQATGGQQFSFQFPINAPFTNTLPGYLTYGTAESAVSAVNGNRAEADAQASMTATASTGSADSESGTINLQDSFQNQLNNGSVYSEGDTNWSYTFNSDRAFAINLSYSVSWFYGSACCPVNHPGFLGALNVTDLDNNTQVFHQDFNVPNGTTLTGSPSPTLLQPGNYTILLYISDIGFMNFPNSSGSQTATLPGSITWGLNPLAEVDINDTVNHERTPGAGDNVTLFNLVPLSQAYIQTIPAKITNTSGTDLKYQLSVVPSSAVTLNETSVSLAAGASTDVTITPTADSAAPNDVHIIAMVGNLKADEDDMTIVRVTIPQDISNTDTPIGMPDRIPPTAPTQLTVQVTPDLSGGGQSVTLAVLGQNVLDGTVMLDGNTANNSADTITSPGTVNISGVDQTAPLGGLTAGLLNLVVQVREANTVQSSGFSVAAILLNWISQLLPPTINNSRHIGMEVADCWQSDSNLNSTPLIQQPSPISTPCLSQRRSSPPLKQAFSQEARLIPPASYPRRS
jgi:hypothetical protein